VSFTDQKRRVATEEDCHLVWNMGEKGAGFRCGLCGRMFQPGDGWRWVYMGAVNSLNILVCDSCDGDDVQERWAERTREFFSDKFWQLRRAYCE